MLLAPGLQAELSLKLLWGEWSKIDGIVCEDMGGMEQDLPQMPISSLPRPSGETYFTKEARSRASAI